MKKLRIANKETKKSVSPVVATILLIVIVIVLALIIYMWASSLIEEIPQKEGKSAEQACQEINLQAQISGNNLYILNIGNIPLYKFDIRKTYEGSVKVENKDESLAPGDSTEIALDRIYEKVEIISVVLGTVDGAEKEYKCDKYIMEV